MRSKRLLPAIFAVLLVVYVLTAVLSGSASYVLAVVFVVGFVLIAVALMGLGRRSLERRHGSADAARTAQVEDNTESLPAAALMPDDGTALGDTTEAHDEITPHDLPMGHPSRARAEELAGHHAATTRGDLPH